MNLYFMQQPVVGAIYIHLICSDSSFFCVYRSNHLHDCPSLTPFTAQAGQPSRPKATIRYRQMPAAHRSHKWSGQDVVSCCCATTATTGHFGRTDGQPNQIPGCVGRSAAAVLCSCRWPPGTAHSATSHYVSNMGRVTEWTRPSNLVAAACCLSSTSSGAGAMHKV